MLLNWRKTREFLLACKGKNKWLEDFYNKVDKKKTGCSKGCSGFGEKFKKELYKKLTEDKAINKLLYEFKDNHPTSAVRKTPAPIFYLTDPTIKKKRLYSVDRIKE